MFLIGIGVYTLVMVIVWGFFLVAKLHVYKFKEYSHLITPMTKLLAIMLVFLTILGYYFLMKMDTSTTTKTQTIEQTSTSEIY